VHIHAQAGRKAGLRSVTTIDRLASPRRTPDRAQVHQLEEPIKQTGIYTVGVRLAPGVAGEIRVWVEKMA
jgi:ribosomal protein L9